MFGLQGITGAPGQKGLYFHNNSVKKTKHFINNFQLKLSLGDVGFNGRRGERGEFGMQGETGPDGLEGKLFQQFKIQTTKIKAAAISF